MSIITDKDIIRFIDMVKSHYPDDANHAPIGQIRKYYDNMCAAMRTGIPEDISVENFSISAIHPHRNVPIRIFTPQSLKTNGVIMFFHGGGFVVGNLESHQGICADISHLTGAKVVAVDYRLLPEHKTPAALDDCHEVLRRLRETHDNIVLMGDSAGGCLAAALCRRLLNRNEAQPAGQVLIYPLLGSVGARGNSWREHANAPLLSAADCEYYEQLYTNGCKIDGEVFPLVENDFFGLAPAVIVSADIDPLRDDSKLYAGCLHQHGVTAVWRNERQLPHSFLRAAKTSKRAASSFKYICSKTLNLLRFDPNSPALPVAKH